MQLIGPAVYILAVVTSHAQAEVAPIARGSTPLRPWILSSDANVAACRDTTGYASFPFKVPGDPTLYDKFCANSDCRVMLANTLAIKTGECFVRDNTANELVNFYEQIVEQFAVACNARTSPPSPAPTPDDCPMW